ncbi:MAG: glycosyltransferase family 2 protein, partial [Alphaproteobacteria bacterium]|nr:glycosyltransferase family 2 protein [Alphaproteobacteria bacterium]
MNLKFESGRSMTEILGVMVIVGVLSVGGITGYSYGMNKHKSNTLLQEANLRATVVSKQIGFHHQSPSLDEFKERDFSYGIFDDKVYGENASSAWTTSDKKFSLKIQSVSQPVCQHLQNEAGGIIQGFSPAECTDDAVVVLTYNPDPVKLRKTLEAAVRQRDVSVEIILSDDGSVKKDFSFLPEFFAQWNFTDYKVVENPQNRGTVYNCYAGVCASSGEYVFLTSPGDILFDDTTMSRFYRFAAQRQAQLCFGNAVRYALVEGQVQRTSLY